MENFWSKLAAKKKPFFVLAPMADVTDFAERQMLVKYGKPDVLYTEFVSADGLAHPKGREILLRDLHFTENEHLIVAQIFGANPENIKKAAQLVRELGFDGIDINMGCPDKAVIKQGAGAALMRTPQLAREIIRAAKEGAKEIPVSVKTRIGFNKIETENWISELVKENPAAIIVHGRTKKELSEVEAHWDEITKAVLIARENGIVIVGNGDVQSLQDGLQKAQESGVDGVMVGRGIFGNPWFFNPRKKIEDISLKERFAVMLEHAKLFEQELSNKNIHPIKSAVGGAKQFDGVKGFHVMKKHFKAYASGFDGAKELRMLLMETNNASEAEKIVNEYLKKVV